MKALHIAKYGRFPQIVETQIPKLKSIECLVKMKVAPINPSDINFFQGFYGIRKQGFPIMGFQGAGQIIQIGKDIDQSLIGHKVSILANKSNGTHANYIASSEQEMIIWPKQQYGDNKIDYLATQWINPVSCIGLTEKINTQKFDSVIISAATSQLAKMLIKFINKKYKHVKIIGFSRSDNLDQQLRKMGLNEIHRIQDEQTIKSLKQNKDKTLCLDCIGGKFASNLFNNLPKNSTMISYGRLSKQPLQSIDLGQLYFQNKKIQGFWMNTFLQNINSQRLKEIKNQIIEYHQDVFKPQIRKKYPLAQYMVAIRESIKNASSGKILLELE